MTPVSPPPTTTTSTAVHRVYWIAGLIMGALWAWNRGEPLWEHALKLGLLLFVAAPLIMGAMKRKHPPRPGQSTLSLARLVAAKVVLVIVALLAAWLLRDRVDQPDLVVAVGITVVIGLIGPRIHRHLMITHQ